MGTQDIQEQLPDTRERSPDAPERSQRVADEPQEERWSSVLREVHDESRDNRPWSQKAGEFLAWAGGIALAADVAAIVVLGIVALVSQGPFTPMEISNWLFWVTCILLFGGLLAPTTTDLQDSAEDRRQRNTRSGASATQRSSSRTRPAAEERGSLQSLETRRVRQLRKRLRRIYNPWRWRLWASAAISLLVTVLIGSFA
jgi:hypothetical protein